MRRDQMRDWAQGRRRRGAATMAVALTGALATALVAGCGVQSSGIVVVGAAPSPVSSSGATAARDGLGETQVTLYFLSGPDGTLVPTVRTVTGPVNESAVITQLVNGPDQVERDDGLYSNLPPGLVATPNAQQLSYAFSLSEQLGQLARAQFICTMQAFDQTIAIGYIYPTMKDMAWVSCGNTTTQLILLPGVPTPATPAAGVTGE
jgi:hypothetical protein